MKKIPKPTIIEFDRQAAWSICCTHNMDSQQFPTVLLRPIPLDQADRFHRELLRNLRGNIIGNTKYKDDKKGMKLNSVYTRLG